MAGIPDPKHAFGGKGPRAPRPAPPPQRKPAPGGAGNGAPRGGNRGQGSGGSGGRHGSGGGGRATVYPANGPLGRALRVEYEARENQDPSTTLQEKKERWEAVGPEANGLVVLRRLSFEPLDGGTNPWKNHVPLHDWAVETRIGQGDAELLRQTLERRRRFLREWVSADPDRRHVLRVRLTVEWRLVSGLGLQFGVLDNGLALHGTYGWPTLSAATLKGLAAAGARSADVDTARVIRALGGPRPRFGKEPRPTREDHSRGSVRFLDALPGEDTVKVHADVITPHQHPYYTSTDTKAHEKAQVRKDAQYPGEHHNPVPLPFLSVSGDLRVELMGDDEDDLNAVFDWLVEAGEELGGGGRTTAGYGYFSCARADGEDA
ncbi:type III-B CRISPR module RAMP protein Cmr6 [Nocardiopsis quinghaiensis]|uniref:type III-B CRISPR module RAMP protein Cmr6 n=1 Tax=Nocardiopsis quinghaiensis TaxID=464995 RepID=UPI001238F3C3|nr:type III-B CRISPR module RAMP protein Cmr6 [Nocardiopsis quinghaiensis]